MGNLKHTALLYDYFVTSRADLLRRYLSTPWELVCIPDPSNIQQAKEHGKPATAFLGNTFPAELARVCPRLQLIQCVGAGVDQFDRQALPPGSRLCNVYEHEIPIAEYILLNILRFATNFAAFESGFRHGRWHGSARHDGEFHGEAFGRTLGLIGYGHIGRAAAIRAQACGMRVIAIDANPADASELDWCGGPDALDRLLAEADFVAVTCPLTDATRGMIGAAQLARMKSSAILINTARAEIVDETALFTALQERRIAGAALDVWYDYPRDIESLQHGSRYPFHELDNVVVTPHLSAWTEPMLDRRYRRIAENLDHLARGEPLERVVHERPRN